MRPARTPRPWTGIPAAMGMLASLVLLGPGTARPAPLLPPNFADDTIVTGLDEPNSMAFLPDGRLVFTEKSNGKIRMIVGNHVAASDPLVVVDGLGDPAGERGLQGIAVDPRWPAFPYVYVGYTHTGPNLWLVRYTATGDLSNPAGETLTLGSPYVIFNDLRDMFAQHNGLGLRFSPSGHLYFSLGEDSDACSAQQVDTLRGKLLRLDVTGLPAGPGGPPPRALITPPDNPFPGASPDGRLVYAYGLRNPWRFHIDPSTGTIALADVGLWAYDEIDEILPGANYGWPHREGPGPGPMVGCLPSGTFTDPIASTVNGDESLAILTAAFYRPVPGGANNWPSDYHGDLFYINYYLSPGLQRIRKSGGSWIVPPPAPGQPTSTEFAVQIWLSVDWAVGPDGSLYWLKSWDDSYNPSSGMLRRIRWTGPPVSVPIVATARELAAFPNPFRDRTTITASTPGQPSVANLIVFDPSGRRVRRLPAAAGSEVTWDGRDERGRVVPPGLYLVRSEQTPNRTLRLLRLR